MSFLFILIQPHAYPAGSVVLSEQLRDLSEVIHLIHVRAEIQLQLSILPGSLVSPQETIKKKKKKTLQIVISVIPLLRFDYFARFAHRTQRSILVTRLLVCFKWIWASLVVQRRRIALQFRNHSRCGFNFWVGNIPWRSLWYPTPVILPGESHGQRSLGGYSPQGHKESDMTDRT